MKLVFAILSLFYLTSAPAMAVTDFTVKKFKLRGVQHHPRQGISPRTLEDKVNQWRIDHHPQARLTLENIDDIAYRISKYYQDLGFSFVTAYVPKQKIKRGIVIIQVQEDVLADVQIRNADKDQQAIMMAEFHHLIGKPVFKPDLEEPILLLNDNPNREVFAYFSRGKNKGETRLNLNVKQNQSHHVSVGMNNAGSPNTGENRWWLAANMKNPFGWDDSINLNLTQAIEQSSNLFGHVSYQRYTNSRSSLSFNLVSNQYELGEDLAFLQLTGSYFSFSIHQRNKEKRSFSKSRNTVYGIEYRQSELSSAVASTSLDQKSGAVIAWYQKASTDYQVIFGDYLTKNIQLNLIALTQEDDQLRDQAFYKLSGFLESGKNIGNYVPGFVTRFTSKLALQYASQNLPGADKSALTGSTGVRAFDSGVFSADQAVVLQLKLGFMTRYDWGTMEPYGYYDHAYGIRKSMGDEVGAELSGFGVGINGSFSKWLNADASFGVSQEAKIGELTKPSATRFLLSLQARVWP